MARGEEVRAPGAASASGDASSYRERASRPGFYAVQAATYDETRGVSGDVMRVLLDALGSPSGRSLLDLGGGTGNYARACADAGFDVRLVDREPAMLERSVAKIGPGRQAVGDVQSLPLRDACADAAIMMNVLHQVADRARALGEARRAVRGGPFAMQVYTAENRGTMFVGEYFGLDVDPSTDLESAGIERMLLSAGFSRVEIRRFEYSDLSDGALTALHIDPDALADERYLRNTSFWHVLAEDVRRDGLAKLGADLRAGRLAERVRESLGYARDHGHGTVFAAYP